MNRLQKLLAIALLTICCQMSAEPVTRQQAQEKAKAFLLEKGKMLSTSGIGHASSKKQMAARATEPYYVFNVEDEGGFVLVSGDDRTIPILGYADSGTFDEEDIPENMQGWLEEYERQIAFLQENDIDAGSSVLARVPSSVQTAVSPLLSSTWGQGAPYNYSCPVYGDWRCVTGCAATAMAQVMYYYRYPSATTAVIPGYTTNNDLAIEVPAIDISAIDWDNMLPGYNNVESTDIQKKAIADLMAMCGSAVKMMYAPNASGAYSYSVPEALVKYFGYNKGLRHLYRSAFHKEEWEGMLYDEINGGHPVLYYGQSTGGGHAFVIDGYDENGYFHVNWGWYGRNDGYFLLSILNPYDTSGIGSSSSADGYSLNQYMIVDVRPDAGGTPDRVLSIYEISAGQTTFTRTSAEEDFCDIPISYYIQNNGTTGKFDLGLGIFDLAGIMQAEAYVAGLDFTEPGDAIRFTRNASFGKGLADGTYRVKALSREYQSTEWFVDYGSNTCYLTATVSGNTLTFGNPVTELTGTITFPVPAEIGKTATGIAEITNTGSDFNGDLYLFIDGHYCIGENFEVAAGTSNTWSFDFMLKQPGEHTLTVASAKRWDEESKEYVVKTVVASTTIHIDGIILETELVVANGTSDFKVEGNIIKFSATVKNVSSQTFEDKASMTLYRKEGSMTYWRSQSKSITLGPQESQVLEFEFSDLMTGGIYYGYIEYHAGNNIWNNEASTEDYTVVLVSPNIEFADAEVKRICVENWDANGDGELSEVEAAAVMSLENVFRGNRNITSFNEFQYFTGVEELEPSEFWYCNNLWAIMFPESLNKIGELAFQNCESLESITLPSSVSELPFGVFAQCYSLINVNLPLSMTTIGVASFANCTSLKSIAIPSSVTSLSSLVFQTCTSLSDVILPSSLKSIGDYSFSYCTNLKQIELPAQLEMLGDGVFYGCSQLQSMFIPKNVKEIGDWQFSYCENLKTLSVSSDNPIFYSINNCILGDMNNIGIVGYGCAGSTIPTIPKVKQIGMYAFEEVTGMKKIVIPDNIVAIGKQAFDQCTDLETITIGKNVTLIQNFAFCRNTNLKQVYALNPIPVEINDNVFHTQIVWNEDGSFNTSKDFTTATLYVPSGSKEAYQQADGWKNFQNIVEILFGDVNGDESVTIADAVAIVNRVLERPSEAFDEVAADVNGDGSINIADAIAIVNIILNRVP